jgi:hypothetical protein
MIVALHAPRCHDVTLSVDTSPRVSSRIPQLATHHFSLAFLTFSDRLSFMMLEPTKLYLLAAARVIALLRHNTITVEDYARSLLGRIDERDSIIKAWEYLGGLSSSCQGAGDGNIY